MQGDFNKALRQLKGLIDSGKMKLSDKVRLVTQNGQFIGFYPVHDCGVNSHLIVTAGQLLNKLESVCGRTR